MGDSDGTKFISFNGINGDTGGYLTDPMRPEDLVDAIKRVTFNQDHLDDLKSRSSGEAAGFAIMPEYGDGSDLSEAGWGLIFPAGADPAQVDAIMKAMDLLINFRKNQSPARFKVFRGADGFQWVAGKPESKNDFVTRHGGSVGPVDPNILPLYLLIVADPLSIPFEFQYELDVQYAVGRIYFDTLEDYGCYAFSVVEAEKAKISLKRRAVFFGVANPYDDATNLSAKYLIQPLQQYASKRSSDHNLGWSAELVQPQDALRANLVELLGGSQTPAFLMTASHGIAWGYNNVEMQRKYQGALVCQDWKGPGVEKVDRPHFLAAEDIPDSHSLAGTIVFHFACFGAGTPYWDDFSIARNKDRTALATRPFLSALPMRLLAHPNGGALAVIGHVERAWSYSFNWADLTAQTQAFQSFLFKLMVGKPVGMAMDDMNLRYAEIATMLAKDIQKVKYEPDKVSPATLSFEWTANNDARSYAVMGDPAVRLPVAPLDTSQEIRPFIALSSHFPGVLPVVLASEALDSLSKDEQTVVSQENDAIQKSAATFSQTAGTDQGASQPMATAWGDQGSNISQSAAPVQTVPPEIKSTSQPVTGTPAQPFVSPIDGLAFALQAYATPAQASFSLEGGVSFNILDDTKDKVKDVVVSLNTALSNLAGKMKDITSDIATLQITTAVVDDLKNFDPANADQRFVTRISATGDIEVFLPKQPEDIDRVLLELHKEMVTQALNNRLEFLKAIADTVSNLFGAQKQ